jgi:DNA mismatch repair protein MutS
VVTRAEAVLALLETGEQSGALARLADDLPLFSAARPARAAVKASAVEAALVEVQPDTLTPRAALELIYRLKGLLTQ